MLPGTDFAWEAWSQLDSDRPVGMGVGRIPWTAIDRYAARHGVDEPDDFDELVELIRAMDDVYLKHVGEEQERASKAASRKPAGRQK